MRGVATTRDIPRADIGSEKRGEDLTRGSRPSEQRKEIDAGSYKPLPGNGSMVRSHFAEILMEQERLWGLLADGKGTS